MLLKLLENVAMNMGRKALANVYRLTCSNTTVNAEQEQSTHLTCRAYLHPQEAIFYSWHFKTFQKIFFAMFPMSIDSCLCIWIWVKSKNILRLWNLYLYLYFVWCRSLIGRSKLSKSTPRGICLTGIKVCLVGCSLQAGGSQLASKQGFQQLPKLINCQPSNFLHAAQPIRTSINISSLQSSTVPRQPRFLSTVDILISDPFWTGISHNMTVPKIVRQHLV